MFQVKFQNGGTFLFPSREAAERYYPLAHFIEKYSISRNGISVIVAEAVLNVKALKF